MNQLAPYWGGRAQMRSPEGWTWWQSAQAPAPGWYWWDEKMNCMAPAHEYEIQHLPLKNVQKVDASQGAMGQQKVPLRLADSLRQGDWVKAWWDGQVAWAVSPTSGPTQPKQPKARRSNEANLRLAVERGGGRLVQATPEKAGWRVHWTRAGVHYHSQVDLSLNVLSAGFCLSGLDRAHDLTSLVSLVEGRESHDADPGVWRRDAGR